MNFLQRYFLVSELIISHYIFTVLHLSWHPPSPRLFLTWPADTERPHYTTSVLNSFLPDQPTQKDHTIQHLSWTPSCLTSRHRKTTLYNICPELLLAWPADTERPHYTTSVLNSFLPDQPTQKDHTIQHLSWTPSCLTSRHRKTTLYNICPELLLAWPAATERPHYTTSVLNSFLPDQPPQKDHTILHLSCTPPPPPPPPDQPTQKDHTILHLQCPPPPPPTHLFLGWPLHRERPLLHLFCFPSSIPIYFGGWLGTKHIGWFSEAGLLERMRFVIFRTRSCERS